MGLKILRGVDPLANARDVPRERWGELVTARKYHCLGNIPSDCRTPLRLVADAEGCEWLGYGTREKYMRNGLDLDPVAVDLAIGFLRAADLIVPIEFATAVAGGRALAKHGANQHSKVGVGNAKSSPTSGGKDSNQVGNAKLIPPSAKGTTVEYIQARLDRDAPELAAQVKAGTKSAHAAAVEAGFRKRQTAIEQLRAAWKRADASEREAFLSEVAKSQPGNGAAG